MTDQPLSHATDPSSEPATATDAHDSPGAPAFTETAEFKQAVEAELNTRLGQLERRWQSRKDREIQRERQRWQQTSKAPASPELSAWARQADPAEVGRWLQELLPADAVAADAPPVSQPADDLADEYVGASEPAEGSDDFQAEQAVARERLADDRAREPSPDLAPSVSAPGDAFHAIEARFARGEIGLADYESARRRRGLD